MMVVIKEGQLIILKPFGIFLSPIWPLFTSQQELPTTITCCTFRTGVNCTRKKQKATRPSRPLQPKPSVNHRNKTSTGNDM